MRNNIRWTFLSIFFVAQGVNAAEQYLCVAEDVTGFAFDGADWKATDFKADQKYIVKLTQHYDAVMEKNAPAAVFQLGKQYPWFYCRSDGSQHDTVSCDGMYGNSFIFSQKNGRFIVSSPIGYISSKGYTDGIRKEGGQTPYMEIGKCSPF